jgi:23S rRNA (cytosine1962-C5)-methyltransferase
LIYKLILKPGEEGRIEAGRPWVYDTQINAIPAGLKPGDVADVESARKRFLGRAIVNPNSKIVARLYSRSKDGLDKGFIKHRIYEAAERRAFAGYDLSRESCRLVFAEADFLPGLIVDRYVGTRVPKESPSPSGGGRVGAGVVVLSVQFLSFGMDKRKEEIVEALCEVCESGFHGMSTSVACVAERDAPVRALEGLPPAGGLLRGEMPEGGIIIEENGLRFMVNPLAGQKTGFFLDQRDNRRAAAAWARHLEGEARVLDVFTCTGGFGLNIAAACPEARVTAVDVSASALESLKTNAALNGLEGRMEAVAQDAFDFLRGACIAKERYDMIVLDPPAFTKGRSGIEDAQRGYKEINLRALELLNKGGILVSCSCSQAMDEHRFKRMIVEAARDAGKRLYELEFRGQAPDHPVLVGHEQSGYLKCGIYRVL